jgi:hypothetical protein
MDSRFGGAKVSISSERLDHWKYWEANVNKMSETRDDGLREVFAGQLQLYTLAAGAAGVSLLALVQPSAAEVVYTAVNKEVVHNGVILVDFNHDGQTDFLIRASYTHQLDFPWNVLNAIPVPAGGIEFGIAGAADLRGGAKIGPGKIFFPNAAVMLAIAVSSDYYGGPWVSSPPNRYLGVKFLIDGQIHYGWARVSAALVGNHVLALLTGYAYETEPGRPIQAGDEGPASISRSKSDSPREPSAGGTLKTQPVSLGALALGAQGLSMWRREETPASQ